ncbi:MAG: hypothetical protein HQK87_00330 [Nitrospinae bacterium]|nr:hypothetical protein [Nitrospinota bacterium]
MKREVIVGQYRIDAAQMVAWEYACEPEKCEERDEYCCARFEVDISRTEMERMTGLMPASARYAPTLMQGRTPVNVFDEFDDDPRRFVIDKNDAGDCVFTFVAAGEKRCALHAACLEIGLDPMKEKPLPCRIWPLTIGDKDPDGKIHVGFDLASNPVCLTKKRRDRKKVSPGVRELLTGLLGKRADAAIRGIEGE